MNTHSNNLTWRSLKTGVASGATIWSVAYLALTTIPAFFGIPPILPLIVDLAAPLLGASYGGFAAYKRHKELQIKEDKKISATEDLLKAAQRLGALRKALEKEKFKFSSQNENVGSIKSSLDFVTKKLNDVDVFIPPKSQFLGSKLERIFKAFVANFPVIQTVLVLLLGVSFLSVTPVGWVIIATSLAGGLAWGITAAIKKGKTVSADEAFAQNYKTSLQVCAAEYEYLKDLVPQQQSQALNSEAQNNPIPSTKESLFSRIVGAVKSNKAIIFSSVSGAASGFAITKVFLAIVLPLLLTAVGIAAPPSLAIMGIAVVVAVATGFAVGKAKQINLHEVESQIVENKKSLENLNSSIEVLENNVKKLDLENTCKPQFQKGPEFDGANAQVGSPNSYGAILQEVVKEKSSNTGPSPKPGVEELAGKLNGASTLSKTIANKSMFFCPDNNIANQTTQESENNNKQSITFSPASAPAA